MERFGAYLRKEREAREISLQDISRATKVRRSILEAIESDRPEVLPPEVFVKAFIKAYAQYIGLDTEEVLSRYREWQKGNLATAREGPVQPRKKEAPKQYILAGAILLAVSIIVFLVLLGKDSKELPSAGTTQEQGDIPSADNVRPSTIMPSAKQPMPLTPLGDDAEEHRESAGEQTELSLEREHVLMIEALEMTWVEIKEGSSPPFDVTLHPGDRYTRRGLHRFELLVGNAGGVKVTFDGRELGSLGKVGQVVKLTLPRERGE